MPCNVATSSCQQSNMTAYILLVVYAICDLRKIPCLCGRNQKPSFMQPMEFRRRRFDIVSSWHWWTYLCFFLESRSHTVVTCILDVKIWNRKEKFLTFQYLSGTYTNTAD